MSAMILVFVVLMFLGAPVFVSMMGASILYIGLDAHGNLISVPHKMLNGIDSFVLLSIPFFLLVGNLMSAGGLMDRLLDFVRQVVGWSRGSTASVNVGSSIIFSGISGSAVADAAAVGSTLIPAMIREKYPPAFAAALTAASSTIGPIIPPSIIMVVLGSLVNISVGSLFLAGVIPGLMVGILLLATSYVLCRIRGFGTETQRFDVNRFALAFYRASGPLLIPLILVGGIIGGFFTPTEASSVAVLTVLVLSFAFYRDLSLGHLWRAIIETLYLLGPLMISISAASVMGDILIEEQVGQKISLVFQDLISDGETLMLAICFVILVLGCFIEAMPIMLTTVPILMPVIISYGIDPVHFGLVMVVTLMLGLITPPVGISMFITCSIAKCDIKSFTKEVFPFFLVLCISITTMIYFPKIVLFLPAMVMN